ncbi:hypothetical protein ETD86_32655 [Nonomuraea turkmeniaca]|uniref:Secreted protein n=1 Tax=Nonomuraea turkmeniaca TaxID=103838 RepID=A0A5S4F7G5_9ACTN|nr:hypothetical protein [Nonomuraea turkmeniaca]TMR12402.1 hypothetical protein ETD86_32655 [Nonomuraea turkmeniaca]
MTRRFLLASTCLLLSGCFASSATTQADHERLEVMLSQPFVREAIKKPAARAAFQKSDKLPATRGVVTAVLADQPAAAPADDARQWAVKGMRKLRDSGWTVYATVCLPPRKSDDPNPPQDGAWDTWSFAAHAYKIVDGVSYFAIAEGLGQLSGSVELSIEMRAPSSHEPVSDLLPERPPALPAGASCVEAGSLPTKKVANGTGVIIGESGRDQAGKEPQNDNVR